MANRRVDMFVTAEDAAVANVWMREQVYHDQGDTFSIALSPDGEEPVTHYAASGVLNEQQWADFLDNPPVSVSYYQSTSTRVRTLQTTTSTTVTPPVTPWPWTKSLENMGLQNVITPLA